MRFQEWPKFKFWMEVLTCNKAILDIVNKGKDTMIFTPEEIIAVIDLRSLGYYKMKQGTLQQYLSRYYIFEKAEKTL